MMIIAVIHSNKTKKENQKTGNKTVQDTDTKEITETNKEMLIKLLLYMKPKLGGSTEIQVLADRLEDYTIDRHRSKILYVLYSVYKPEKDNRYYICKAFQLINNNHYDIKSLLEHKSKNQDRAAKDCGFEAAFDLSGLQLKGEAKSHTKIEKKVEVKKKKHGKEISSFQSEESFFNDDFNNLFKQSFDELTKSKTEKDGVKSETVKHKSHKKMSGEVIGGPGESVSISSS